MITFIYTVEHASDKRGYNRTVNVWRIKNNKPLFVGYDDKINTAAYKGDRAIASHIISKECGYKMKDGYRLASDKIQIFEI